MNYPYSDKGKSVKIAFDKKARHRCTVPDVSIDKTVIILTHRPATLAIYDRVPEFSEDIVRERT